MTEATIEAPNAIAENLDKVQTELAVIDNISAGLAELNKKHPKNLACDVATTKGMKEAIAGRAAWRDPRIATEKARKAAKAPVLELGRAIDARAAEITGFLLEGESNYDDQIKAEEARKEAERAAKAEAERQRMAVIGVEIDGIKNWAAFAIGKSADAILGMLSSVEGIEIDAAFEEFQGQAQLAKDETLDKLRALHADALAREKEAARVKAEQEAAAAALAAERAELARLRAEQEARDREAAAVLAAERAKQEAELKAQREAAAVEAKRIADERAALERAQTEKLAAERAAQDEELRKQREAQEAELRAQREAQAKADAEAAAARKAEDDRIAAQLAELAAQREQQAAAARAAEEAKHAAEKLARDAAPVMLAALKSVRASGAWSDIEDHIRETVERAIEEATGLPA